VLLANAKREERGKNTESERRARKGHSRGLTSEEEDIFPE